VTIHFCMTREYLVRQVLELGPADVFAKGTAWAEMTADDALAAIYASGRLYFTLGDCDAQDAEGRCAGHRSKLRSVP
jgi:hypothetical protein